VAYSRQVKLTADDAKAIKASTDGAMCLARKYGVSPQTIWAIRTNRTWKEVA
jgi:hypothetical protein